MDLKGNNGTSLFHFWKIEFGHHHQIPIKGVTPMKKAADIGAITILTFLNLGVAHAATPPVTTPLVSLAPAAHKGAAPDDATKMLLAQNALQSAENNLLHISQEYGGHRQKATQAITTALNELKLAQQPQPVKI
jgi:hypothetical protein